MHSNSVAVAILAVLASAVTAESELHPSISPLASDQAGSQIPLYSLGGDRNHAVPVVQQAVAASVSQRTTMQVLMDNDPILRYLPKPSPIPTTTPQYPEHPAQQLNSVLAKEKAKSEKSQGTISVNAADASVISSLQSEIQSLHRATLSAVGSLAFISKASKTQSSNLASASKALKNKEHQLHDKQRKISSGHSLSVPSVNFAASMVAAIGLAGLAFVL